MPSVVGNVPAIVQTKGVFTASPGATTDYVPDTAPTIQNTLLAIIARVGQTDPINDITDDGGGEWARIALLPANSATGYANTRIEVWACYSVLASTTTITIDYNSDWADNTSVAIVELSGITNVATGAVRYDGDGSDAEISIKTDVIDSSTVRATSEFSLSLVAAFTSTTAAPPATLVPELPWVLQKRVTDTTTAPALDIFTRTRTSLPDEDEELTLKRGDLETLLPTGALLFTFAGTGEISRDTYSTLKTAAISLADMTNSAFITDAEWQRWGNQGLNKLYDLLVRSHENYFERTATISVVSGTDSYALPSRFYKLLSVDVQITTDEWYTILPYQAAERNRFDRYWRRRAPVRNLHAYRIVGDKIRFRPLPSSTDTVRLRYVPLPVPFIESTQEELPNALMEHWSEYIVLWMAVQALRKEESPTNDLRAEMADMEARIRAGASERNVGDVLCVADVRRVDFDDEDFGAW